MDGFYSISRAHNDTIRDLSSDAAKLYYFLVRRAAYKDSPLCAMGSLFDSLIGMAERAGLTVQNVRTSLKKLECVGLIVVKRHEKRHDIQVVGYSKSEIAIRTTNTQVTRSQHAANTQVTRLEEVNKAIKNNSIPIVSSKGEIDIAVEFNRIWERYPKPRGKKAALRHFQASVKTAQDVVAIHGALDAYLAELKSLGRSLEFTLNGSTWFNDWHSHKPAVKLAVLPTTQAPKEIPEWKRVIPEEDLVPAAEVTAFVASLRAKSIK